MATNDRASLQTLINENRYKVDIIPQLEAYVQNASNEYFLEADLALLKLYQFHPDKIILEIVRTILLKALTHLPNTDYIFASSLISESLQSDEKIVAIGNLSTLLETAQFQKFWETLNATPDLVTNVPKFQEAIRTYISTTLKITYQVVAKAYLGSVLNLEGDALNAYITANEWQQVDNTVRFPIIEENQAKPKKIAEQISFEQIGKVLKTVH